jgi:type II secretory pathway component PulM
MSKTRVWWQSKLPRERALLALCLLAMLGGVLQFGWQQAVDFRDRSQQALEQEKKLLLTLPQLELALAKRVSSGQKNTPRVEELTTLAAQQGISLALTSQGKSWVLASPAEIQFQSLLNWLNVLETRWQLRPSKLEVQRAGQQVQLRVLELQHDL